MKTYSPTKILNIIDILCSTLDNLKCSSNTLPTKSVISKNFSEKMDTILKTRASQVALVVKNPPASAADIRDMGLISGLGRSLEEGMATHSSILAWATVHRVAKSQTLVRNLAHTHTLRSY